MNDLPPKMLIGYKDRRSLSVRPFMRMSAFMLFLIIASAVGQPLRPIEQLTPDQAYEQLLKVHNFSFGGVFADGIGTRGERLYHVIAGSTNAVALFSATYTNGNSQAKLFALCGIRQFAPSQFDSLATSLCLSNPVVDITHGDRIRHDYASNLVYRISSGHYDVYIKDTKK